MELVCATDRETIFEYIEVDGRRAAIRIDDRIQAQVDRLALFPESGRPGRIGGTRELVIRQTAYIAAYRITQDTVKVLRILHGSQQWPAEFEGLP